MMQPRRDYHQRCPIYNIQRQTCRHCVVDAIDWCLILGLGKDETFFEARDVSKGYFCLACLRASIHAGRVAQEDLRIARSCPEHLDAFAIKRCPCGKDWENCLDCMLRGVDPRAGIAICYRCHRRRGRRAGFCSCPAMVAGDWLPSTVSAIEIADSFLATDFHEDSAGAA